MSQQTHGATHVVVQKMSQQVFCELNYIYKCPPHQTSFSSKLKYTKSSSDKLHGLRNMTRQPFTNLHSPTRSETIVQNLSNINFREQFSIKVAYILFSFLGLMKPNCIKNNKVTHSQVKHKILENWVLKIYGTTWFGRS